MVCARFGIVTDVASSRLLPDLWSPMVRPVLVCGGVAISHLQSTVETAHSDTFHIMDTVDRWVVQCVSPTDNRHGIAGSELPRRSNDVVRCLP